MKNSIFFIACALMISGRTYGQKLSTIPKATTIDTGSYFSGVENVSGVFTTKLFRASLMIPYIVDTVADTPGGVTNSIQTKSGTGTFAGASQFTYSGTTFQVGFPSSTQHLTITNSGQCSIGLTDLMSMSSTTGALYFDADPVTELYHFGYPSSGRLTIDAFNGKDTLSGILVMPDLAGNGAGVMSVANDGTLGWMAAPTSSGYTLLSSSHLVGINATTAVTGFAATGNGQYIVGGNITVSSVAGGATANLRVTWTDENNNINIYNFPTVTATAQVGVPPVYIYAKVATAITVSCFIVSGGGSIICNPSASIFRSF